ncbi:MAG: hypothetical protein R3200_17455 [Xanthomonadales bacterium]|nr:hypothetical protein [Xanthomonadales bacterium]
MKRQALAVLLATVCSSAALAQTVAPQAGVYWNPGLSGVGFALEIQGDLTFVVAFSYDESGEQVWHAGSSRIDGEDTLNLELDRFLDGPCLGCDPEPGDPSAAGEVLEVTLTFTGSGQALMQIGDREEVFELQRFALTTVQSEGTIAGQTFTMPDLTGRWLFTDTVDGDFHVVTDLEVAFSGISDSGLAFFRAPDGNFGVACGRTIEGVLCDFKPSDEPDLTEVLFTAAEADISHDHISAEGVVGIRLR